MKKKNNKKVDIKYLGIPNICFSLSKKDDKREKVFKKQRLERGFDDSETWSLDYTISDFIVPRLERYIEITDSIHEGDNKDERKLLKALKLYSEDRINYTKKEEKIIDKGLKVFPKIFGRLWW